MPNYSSTKLWVKSPADEIAVSNGCYFDEAAARRVEDFFRTFLRHSKGQFAGKPFELLKWQRRDIIYPVFGWKRADGRRRFQRVYVEIPKKNGKSTIAAGIGLYLLIGDGEPGAEVYSAAVTRQQAGIVHGEAIRMVQASEGLSECTSINRSTKEITFEPNQSVYRALPAEANSAEGLNIHGLIADELHAWPGEAGRKFWEALKYGGKARRQPLYFVITTAGNDLLSVCYELHQYGKAVAAGEIEDQRFFSYIRSIDAGDDFRDKASWYKANPSLGETMTEEDFKADVKEAEKTPTALAQFLRYAFNIWHQGGASAIRPEQWRLCKDKFEEAELDGQRCFAAIDLSRTRDLTAAAFLFPQDDGTYRVIVRCWLPKATLELASTPSQFRAWADKGLIIATEGNVTDYDKVEADLTELFGRFSVEEFTFDPWMAEETTQRLSDATGVERVAFNQTILNYAAPCAEFERLVIAKKIRHDGNPLLAWQVCNLQWRIDPAGNRRPHKAAERNKIDAAVAIIMALGRAMIAQDAGDVSITSF